MIDKALDQIALDDNGGCSNDKIVHGLAIAAQTIGVPGATPLGSTVALRGEKCKETWLAHLNIFDYVRTSFRNFEGGI